MDQHNVANYLFTIHQSALWKQLWEHTEMQFAFLQEYQNYVIKWS